MCIILRCVVNTEWPQEVLQADRIVVIADGRVVEQGAHAGLMARGGAYAELVERQLL